jgi:Protein of unknown function (DUF4240)
LRVTSHSGWPRPTAGTCGGWPTSSTAAAPTTALFTSAAGCWLLAQGRATWEAALGDPDSLIDHPLANKSGQDLECEPMLYVAGNAYHTRAEAELPTDSHIRQPAEPLGEHWDFENDDEVRRRLPRVWARMT